MLLCSADWEFTVRQRDEGGERIFGKVKDVGNVIVKCAMDATLLVLPRIQPLASPVY